MHVDVGRLAALGQALVAISQLAPGGLRSGLCGVVDLTGHS
jgi:hypothetical protein